MLLSDSLCLWRTQSPSGRARYLVLWFSMVGGEGERGWGWASETYTYLREENRRYNQRAVLVDYISDLALLRDLSGDHRSSINGILKQLKSARSSRLSMQPLPKQPARAAPLQLLSQYKSCLNPLSLCSY